jgi:hypothetical protein
MNFKRKKTDFYLRDNKQKMCRIPGSHIIILKLKDEQCKTKTNQISKQEMRNIIPAAFMKGRIS